MAAAFLWLGACGEGADPMGTEPLHGDMPMAGVGGAVEPGPVAGSGDVTNPDPGMAGAPADDGTAGMAGADAGLAGTGGPDAGTGGDPDAPLNGSCCSDGDCLCHGSDPRQLTSSNGSYPTATLRGSTGTIHYPTNAEPPFAGIAICGGLFNTGPEMDAWGEFYASHGIVTVITSTLGADLPPTRAQKLLASIHELKTQNTTSSSPLFGKMSDRYGVSGYSMGGGGTTLAAIEDPTLRSAVPLAAWGGNGTNVRVPMLLLCGTSDTTAPCSMSQSVYRALPAATPKMMLSIDGANHFAWFGPTNAGRGTSGSYALAFQKVYLEGDQRWQSLLATNPSGATMTTTIQ